MSWVKLDDRFPDNPKIAPLSDRAFVAYVTSVCYCARELTDGFIPAKTARMYAGKASAVKELTPHLWEPCAGGFNVHDFLEYNPPRSHVLAVKQTRSEAGSKGAANRWQSAKQNEGQTDGKSDAPLPVSPSSVPVAPENPEPEHPARPRFDTEWVRHQEILKGTHPGGAAVAAASQLERDFGYEACMQAAIDTQWQKHPNYLRPILEERRGNSSRTGGGKPATEQGADRVADRVPGLDEREPSIAEQRRRRVPVS